MQISGVLYKCEITSLAEMIRLIILDLILLNEHTRITYEYGKQRFLVVRCLECRVWSILFWVEVMKVSDEIRAPCRILVRFPLRWVVISSLSEFIYQAPSLVCCWVDPPVIYA